MKILLLLLGLSIVICQIEIFRKSSQRLGQNSAGNFSMDNEKDYQYYAFLGIGTPAQNCSIVFDTNYNSFWVSTIWGDYNSSKSSTYNVSTQTKNVSFGAGYVSGYMGTEILSVPQISITNISQSMLFVNKQSQQNNATDGLLGLTNDAATQNWLDLAKNAGQLKDAKFAFDLRNQDTVTYFYAGSTSFPNETLTWINVSMQYYWGIPIQSTTIDNQTQPQDYNAQNAILDTGISFLIMGEIGYNMLQNDQQIFQCRFHQQSDLFICPCNGTYPTITFTSGNMSYLVVPSDYLISLQGGYCALAVKPNDGYSVMIFGDSVLRNYFVAFDKSKSQVGFSAPESTKSKIFKKRFLN